MHTPIKKVFLGQFLAWVDVWDTAVRHTRCAQYYQDLSVAKQGLTEQNPNIKEKEAPRSDRHDSIGLPYAVQ